MSGGGVHHWLKRKSTREERKPATRDDDDDDDNNNNNNNNFCRFFLLTKFNLTEQRQSPCFSMNLITRLKTANVLKFKQ
jgi:hypothetical protein